MPRRLPSWCTTLFPYEVISGDPQQALLDEHNAVLTASFSRKAFGTSDPIGQTLRMGEQLYTVAAVVADGGPYLNEGSEVWYRVGWKV